VLSVNRLLSLIKIFVCAKVESGAKTKNQSMASNTEFVVVIRGELCFEILACLDA
jgi:hypothetical protein